MNGMSPDPRLPNDGSPLTNRLYELFRDVASRLNFLLTGGTLVVTTTEKNALNAFAGQVVFDSTLGKLCIYTGSAWQTVTST